MNLCNLTCDLFKIITNYSIKLKRNGFSKHMPKLPIGSPGRFYFNSQITKNLTFNSSVSF